MDKRLATVALVAAPKQASQVLLSQGASVGWLAALIVTEVLLVSPLAVLTQLFRLTSSPFGAAVGLWQLIVRHALVPLVVAAIVGILLTKLAAARHAQKVPLGLSVPVAMTLYIPHVIAVAAFVIAAALGAQASADVVSTVSWAVCVPALALVTVGLVRPSTSEAYPKQRVSVWLVASGLVLCAALGLTAQSAYQKRHHSRPILPGDTLADLALTGLDGTKLRTSQLHGKVALLDVWATWCPPCVASMPGLQNLHQDLASRGFSLVSINVEPQAKDDVRAFVTDHELTFPVYIDDGRAQRALRVMSYPSLFLVDRQGVVRETYVGVVPETLLRSDIESLLEN